MREKRGLRYFGGRKKGAMTFFERKKMGRGLFLKEKKGGEKFFSLSNLNFDDIKRHFFVRKSSFLKR